MMAPWLVEWSWYISITRAKVLILFIARLTVDLPFVVGSFPSSYHSLMEKGEPLRLTLCLFGRQPHIPVATTFSPPTIPSKHHL